MIQSILKKVMGTKYERELKRLTPYVEAICALEPKVQKLSDAELRAKTSYFKEQVNKKYADYQPEIEILEAEIALTSGDEKQKLRIKLNKTLETLRYLKCPYL